MMEMEIKRKQGQISVRKLAIISLVVGILSFMGSILGVYFSWGMKEKATAAKKAAKRAEKAAKEVQQMLKKGKGTRLAFICLAVRSPANSLEQDHF